MSDQTKECEVESKSMGNRGLPRNIRNDNIRAGAGEDIVRAVRGGDDDLSGGAGKLRSTAIRPISNDDSWRQAA